MKMKRILGGVVALLVAALSVGTPFSASATGEIDFSKTGTIHITLESSGTISAYYVASILSNCEYEYVEDCAESGIELEDLLEGDAESAQDMAEWCVDSDLVPVTVEISGNSVTFDNLDLGLYIIIQAESGGDYYPILPFAVTVPANIDGEYDYAVDATPKVETEMDDDSSSARTQNEDDTDVEGNKDTPGSDSDSSSARANGSRDDDSSSSRITGGSDTADAEDTNGDDSSSITSGGNGDESGDGVSSDDSIFGDTNDASNNGGGVYGIISAGSSLNGGDSGDAGTLPQTGQLQWPIPVFGACGLFLILLGGTIRFATRRSAYKQNGAQ